MSTAYTFYWSEIFPNYDTFRTFNQLYNVVDLTPSIPERETFLTYCYKILSRYFWNWNVRYSSVNDFCRALASVLEDRFEQFRHQQELIQKAYDLSTDDIAQVQEALNNAADNPNTMPQDPKSPLNFISSQVYGYIRENRLKAYLKAINDMPNLRINEFIRGRASYADEISFIDLFMNVQPNQEYLYDKE